MTPQQIETVATVLANSTSRYEGTFDMNMAIQNADDFGPDYLVAAEAIVEPYNLPEDCEEAYHMYMEEDAENWVSWVRQTCGEDWGTIASKVTELGY